MNTLIFAGGLLIGALSAFVFMSIMAAISSSNNKKKAAQDTTKEIFNEDLVMKLFDMYLRETRDDGK